MLVPRSRLRPPCGPPRHLRSRLVPGPDGDVLVCLAGLPGPRPRPDSPEAARTSPAPGACFAGAASGHLAQPGHGAQPADPACGRFELARAAGTLQLLLGGGATRPVLPWRWRRQARRLARGRPLLDARAQVEMQLSGNYGAADALTAQLLERPGRQAMNCLQASAEGFPASWRRHGELEAARQKETPWPCAARLGDDAGIPRPRPTSARFIATRRLRPRAGPAAGGTDLRRRLGLGERVDLSYRNIALLYRGIEDAEQARANFSAALAAAEARHDPASLATVLAASPVSATTTANPMRPCVRHSRRWPIERPTALRRS